MAYEGGEMKYLSDEELRAIVKADPDPYMPSIRAIANAASDARAEYERERILEWVAEQHDSRFKEGNVIGVITWRNFYDKLSEWLESEGK